MNKLALVMEKNIGGIEIKFKLIRKPFLQKKMQTKK